MPDGEELSYEMEGVYFDFLAYLLLERRLVKLLEEKCRVDASAMKGYLAALPTGR